MSNPNSPYPDAPAGTAYAPAPPAPPAPKNGFGITAFVLGLIGLVIAFIPFVSLFLSIPLGIIGTIFAIAGFLRISKGIATNKGLTIVGVIASVLAIIVAIATTTFTGAFIGAMFDDSSSSSTTSGDVGEVEKAAAAEADTADDEIAEEQFSGQEASDIVGDAGDTLEARGVTVTASALEERSGVLGDYLCSDLQYENNSDERVSYNTFDWSLQDPNGGIQMSTIAGEDDELSSGELAPGGTTEGAVCFEPVDESGQYVLLFEGFISFDSSRAAWINEL